MSDTSNKPFEPFKARDTFLSDVAEAAIPGAYAILHTASKKAWVGRGENWVTGLVRNVVALEHGEHLSKEFQKEWNRSMVIDEVPDFEAVWEPRADPMEAYRLIYQWCEAQGYKVLSQAPVSWAPVLEVIEDPRSDAGRVGRFPTYLAAVWNKASSGRKILGKVFETVDEARVWSEAQFPGGRAWEPQVSNDELTVGVETLL